MHPPSQHCSPVRQVPDPQQTSDELTQVPPQHCCPPSQQPPPQGTVHCVPPPPPLPLEVPPPPPDPTVGAPLVHQFAAVCAAAVQLLQLAQTTFEAPVRL